jgi:anti-sigma regulatory factor (Ser/Thr protein kinase)
MDPYEVLRQVMEYCNKYGMTRQQRDTIRLICEEYLSNLIKMPGRDARVTVIVRYNEKDQTRELEFRDTYPEANHLEGEDFDEISARLIQGYAASLEYRYLDGVNAVRIQVK